MIKNVNCSLHQSVFSYTICLILFVMNKGASIFPLYLQSSFFFFNLSMKIDSTLIKDNRENELYGVIYCYSSVVFFGSQIYVHQKVWMNIQMKKEGSKLQLFLLTFLWKFKGAFHFFMLILEFYI